jgi:hypothetical protein
MTPLSISRYFLVLHRDFDNPVLDLCTIVQIEGEALYVTSTGHRVKPAAVWFLGDCLSNAPDILQAFAETDWAAVPTFFSASKSPDRDRKAELAAGKAEGANLLASLGLAKPVEKLKLGGNDATS